MEEYALQTDWFAREFPARRAPVSAIIGYESPAAAFPWLILRGSWQFALGCDHNSPLEMARLDDPRSGAGFESIRFESVHLESSCGISGRVCGCSPRSWLEYAQHMGRRRPQEVHH